MPNLNVNFLGNLLVLPGAYYADDVSAALTPVQSLTPPLIFIGNFFGLQPKTPVTYTNAQDAQNAMRGAPAAQYIPFMTNPSPSLFGAQYITLINASENVQSTATISSSNGASGLITLTSANYGAASNLLEYSIEVGSLSGYLITLYDGYANTAVTGDNLGVPFNIAYTGSASSVTCSVTVVSGAATAFVLNSPNSGESFTIPIGAAGYSTVGSLVSYINGTGFYVASALSNSNLPCSNLDTTTNLALPAPSAGVYTYTQITATIGDILYWVNNVASTFATGVIAGGAVLNTAYTLNTAGNQILFTGGQNIPPTNSDYAAAFNVALNTPGWAVFADSNSQAVMALGEQHAQTASTPLYGSWRRFVTGSNIGDSVTTTVQNASQLNTITSTYCYPGIYRTNTTTGLNQLYGGLALAAAVAGIMCGNIIAQPLTNQQISGNGVEKAGGANSYLTTSQINQLQQAGVLVLKLSSSNIPTIVSDFTTWQGDANPENVFNQQVACRWGLAYSLVAAAQPYIGTIASPYGLTNVKNAIKTQLNNLIYSPGNNGVLVSWDAKSLVLTYTGATQTLYIKVNVVLVGQIRFILEQTFVQPLNLTA